MNVKECIMNRRSIRKYKDEEVPEELIYDLIDCARLAPSACHAQPWRFHIVRDSETKHKLSMISFNQKHVEEAPVVLVCCAHIDDYIQGSLAGSDELYQKEEISKNIYDAVQYRAKSLKEKQIEHLSAEVSFNTVAAIEHIVLRAVELGLGTCWTKFSDDRKIRELFQWDENICFVSLLTIGYPAGYPKPIKRLSLEEILI